MRLRIQMKADHLKLPISYKYIIQGVIYHMFDHSHYGKFYHDKGYKYENKKFKVFVFSDLYGHYTIKDKSIIFDDKVTLYIGSLDNDFIKTVYNYLIQNDYLIINKQKAEISDLHFFESPHFKGEKEVTIKTLSPIVVYTTLENHYVRYYSPIENEFVQGIYNNIKDTAIAYQYPINKIIFDVIQINYFKKKIVYYKKTLYVGYQCIMKIKVNYETLKLIYDTGLSSKGSCGFGMITIKDEKSNISL